MKGPTKLQLPSLPYSASNSSQKEGESYAVEPIDKKLLMKAIKALVTYHNGTVTKAHQESNTIPLLGSDAAIHVQFSLARVPEKTSHRPIRLDLPHPLFRLPSMDDTTATDVKEVDYLDDVEVCLIVKDEAKPAIKNLIDLFPHHKAMTRIKKVLTLTSLRTKYGRYADRRELLARYEFFLADDRILPMLGRALGKNFFEKKKQPIPIRITQTKQLPFAVDACLRGTFLFIRPGTCISVKVGHTHMPNENLMDNIEAVITQVVPRIPRKWANVMSISIKTYQSVALPIYNKTREELQLITEMANTDSTEEEMYTDNNKKRARDTRDENPEDKMPKMRNASSTTAVNVVEEKQHKDAAKESPLIQALKKQKKEVDMNERKDKPLLTKPGTEFASVESNTSLASVKRKSPNSTDGSSRSAKVTGSDIEMSKMKAHDLGEQVNNREAVMNEKKPKMIHPTLNSSEKMKLERRDLELRDSSVLMKSLGIKNKSDTEKKAYARNLVLHKSKTETKRHESGRESDKDKMKSSIQESSHQKSPKSDDNKKKSDVGATASKTMTKINDAKKPDDNFIAESKFIGAKKGFVFRNGLRGLGYYKDILPMVHKLERGKRR